MLKFLVVIAAFAVASPNFAFAQQNPSDPPNSQGAPGGPSNLTVSPPGLQNNDHGPPNLPAVFTAAGQPTGGSPAGGPNVTPGQGRGTATFHSP